jgi:hypothetical protein
LDYRPNTKQYIDRNPICQRFFLIILYVFRSGRGRFEFILSLKYG